MGYPIAGWFTMEHPIEMDDDWGYPYFGKLHTVIQVLCVI